MKIKVVSAKIESTKLEIGALQFFLILMLGKERKVVAEKTGR